MLDLPLVLACFMGDAQTSKEKKQQQKYSENQTTQWRFLRHPVEI